jgi:hypothetical protein
MIRRYRAITALALLVAPASLCWPVHAADGPPAPPSGGFMLADVNGDGRLTLDELQTLLSARFAALDTDSDGRIAFAALGGREQDAAGERFVPASAPCRRRPGVFAVRRPAGEAVRLPARRPAKPHTGGPAAPRRAPISLGRAPKIAMKTG